MLQKGVNLFQLIGGVLTVIIFLGAAYMGIMNRFNEIENNQSLDKQRIIRNEREINYVVKERKKFQSQRHEDEKQLQKSIIELQHSVIRLTEVVEDMKAKMEK